MVAPPAQHSVKGYEAFFGFREAPFSLAPNTRFLFDSASHAAARSQVTYALERREPMVVVTGDIGTGKTLLCRSVVEGLERKAFLAVIHDPLVDADEILKLMLQDFGVISKDRTRLTPTTRHDLVHALQEFLLSLVPLQAHAVLVIDEAQHLQPDVLEQIRLVSNIHDEGGTMLQIILVGQPSLELLLSRPDLAQVRQRISRYCRLEPLGSAEVAKYIEHRLAIARGNAASAQSGVEFGRDTAAAIWRLSGGIPRVVNLICDRALEVAFAQQVRTIDSALVGSAARQLDLRAVPEPPLPLAPAEALWAPPAHDAAPGEDAGEEIQRPIEEGSFGAEEPSRSRLGLLIAGGVAVTAVAIWFGIRMLTAGDDPPAPNATSAPPAQSRPEPAPPTTGPPAQSTPAQPAPAPPTTPPPVEGAAPAPVQPSAGQPGTAPPIAAPVSTPPAPQETGSFEIVVASFRTATRAATVADELRALGQPVRQRVSDGWQQILAGPFASRAAAEDAQRRLEAAGYTGTQVVPILR